MIKRLLKMFLIIFVIIFIQVTVCGIRVYAQSDFNVEEEKNTAMEKADELLSGNFLKDTLSSFSREISESVKGFSKVFALLIFATFMTSVMRLMNVGNSAIYAGEICLCSLAFSVISNVMNNITVWLSAVENFMLSMLPVMTSLYVTSGAASAASVNFTSTVLSLNVCNILFSSVIIPGVKCMAFLAVMSFLSRSFDFSGITAFVKNTLGWIFGLLMCMMSAIIAFQNIIAVSKDGVSGRAIRFAAARFIPVVGGTVSESARTVSQSLKLVRSVSGVAGIFGIAGAIAVPVVSILVCRFFVNVCAAVAKMFSEGKAAAFFTELSGIMNLMLGAVVGSSLVFTLILGIFAGSAITV